MDSNDATTRAVVLGHLMITIPIFLIIALVIRWGLYQFGPSLLPYYISGGIALAWQWYSLALLRWKGLLRKNGLQADQAEGIAQRGGLARPGIGSIGSFTLHTTTAALCGIHFGPWLLSRWFLWILPLFGFS